MPPFLASSTELAAVTAANTVVELSWASVLEAKSYLVNLGATLSVAIDPLLVTPASTTGASLALLDISPGEIRDVRGRWRRKVRCQASVEVRVMVGRLLSLVSGADAKSVVGQGAPDDHIVGESDDLFGAAGSPAGLPLSHTTHTLFVFDPATSRLWGLFPRPPRAAPRRELASTPSTPTAGGVKESRDLRLASPANVSAHGEGRVVAGSEMKDAAYDGALPTPIETTFHATIGAHSPSMPVPARAVSTGARPRSRGAPTC